MRNVWLGKRSLGLLLIAKLHHVGWAGKTVVTSVDQQLIKKTLESEPEQDLAHLRLLGLSPRA